MDCEPRSFQKGDRVIVKGRQLGVVADIQGSIAKIQLDSSLRITTAVANLEHVDDDTSKSTRVDESPPPDPDCRD